MSLQQLDLERKRLQRMRVLQTLYNNRPNTTGDGLLRQALKHDIDLGFTHNSIRKSLDYLEQRKLVEITDRTDQAWMAKITADGIDHIDGIGPDVPGVAKPDEF